MRQGLCLFLFSVYLFLAPLTTYAEDLPSLLRDPLILGASVSADFGTASPGRRLVLPYTQEKRIRTRAAAGRSATELLPKVGEEDFRDRSVIIALDLFFWDSVRRNPERSVHVLKSLVQRARDRDIPLILGNIPDLMGSKQPGRRRLNQEITRLCKVPHGCYLIPLAELHERVRQGGLEIEDRLVQEKELLDEDGLHLSALGSQYIADGIKEILSK